MEKSAKLSSELTALKAITASVAIPFFTYVTADSFEVLDVRAICYCVLTAILSLTAILLWGKLIQVLVKLRNASVMKTPLPERRKRLSYPPASAVIVGHLPREADALLQTVESFLSVEYPGTLQIVVAYSSDENASQPEVEQSLAALTSNKPQLFSLYKMVDAMTQEDTIAAAARLATGEFVGIFTAGQIPNEDCMIQALDWTESQRELERKSTVDVDGSSWAVNELKEGFANAAKESLSEESLILKLDIGFQRFLHSFQCSLEMEGSSVWHMLHRNDLSKSQKLAALHTFLWVKLLPMVVLQIIPAAAFLFYKQSSLSNLDRLQASHLATSIMMSR